jgi:hypothetical protein
MYSSDTDASRCAATRSTAVIPGGPTYGVFAIARHLLSEDLAATPADALAAAIRILRDSPELASRPADAWTAGFEATIGGS